MFCDYSGIEIDVLEKYVITVSFLSYLNYFCKAGFKYKKREYQKDSSFLRSDSSYVYRRYWSVHSTKKRPKLEKILDKIWNLEVFKIFLQLRNYGMDFRFSENNESIVGRFTWYEVWMYLKARRMQDLRNMQCFWGDIILMIFFRPFKFNKGLNFLIYRHIIWSDSKENT